MNKTELVEAMVKEAFPTVEVFISDFGPVIGAHVGPGSLALCYLGNCTKGK